MTDTSQPTTNPVYTKRPVMFGANPVGFVLLWLLIPVGIWGLMTGASLLGILSNRLVYVLCIFAPTALVLLMLFSWWLGSFANRLTIEGRTVIHQQGILSKRVKEIAIAKIRTVEVFQTPFQRLTNVGKVRIFGTGDKPEIVLGGLPRPDIIKEVLSVKVKDDQE